MLEFSYYITDITYHYYVFYFSDFLLRTVLDITTSATLDWGGRSALSAAFTREFAVVYNFLLRSYGEWQLGNFIICILTRTRAASMNEEKELHYEKATILPHNRVWHKEKMSDATMLLFLSVIMLIGSFLSGSLPLIMTLSEVN